MWNIKKITILLCFLSLVAFISCSAEDKTGSPKPEGETEITGETGGGSGTGGGSSGETKITIPEKYHGNYTRRGWSSFDDDAEIYADKIVLKLGKKYGEQRQIFREHIKLPMPLLKRIPKLSIET